MPNRYSNKMQKLRSMLNRTCTSTVVFLCFIVLAAGCMSEERKSGYDVERYNISKGNTVYSEKAIPMINIDGTYFVSSQSLLEQMEYNSVTDVQNKQVSFGYNDILFQVFADRHEAIKDEETVRLSKKPIWRDGQVWFPDTLMDELLQEEVFYTVKHHHIILHPFREHPPIVADGSKEERAQQRNLSDADSDSANEGNDSSAMPNYGWNTIDNPHVREGQPLATQPEAQREQRPHVHNGDQAGGDQQAEKGTSDRSYQITNTSAQVDQLIQYAKKYLGVKYEFGAKPYEQSGTFDCSSYTEHVFGRFGIDMPRSARSQAKKGKTISRSQLKPGDLMYFSVPGRFSSDKVVGHVAIYIGNGKMIHSSPAPENGVQITNIDRDHWKKTYLFSKRIL